MPFWITHIETPLSARAANEKLRELVRPRRGLRKTIEDGLVPPPGDHPFEGDVDDRTFKVMRVIRYRNSFLPVIHGRIEQARNGATVHLRMRVHLFTAVFMMIWFGMLAASFDRVSVAQLSALETSAVVSVGMLLFGVLLVVAGFVPEAVKAVRLLRKALQ